MISRVQTNNDEKITFILLFSRNQPSCDVPYLMANRDERIYPTLLSNEREFNLKLFYHTIIDYQNAYKTRSDVIDTFGFFCFRCWNIKFCFLSSCSMYSSTNFEMISLHRMMMILKNVKNM